MNENLNDQCEHSWIKAGTAGVCTLCGQARAFPQGDKHPHILWPSRDCKDDPLSLPREAKELIAAVGKEHGIKKVAECTHIPWTVVRAWVGAYVRDPRRCKERLALGRAARGQAVTDPPAPAAAPDPAQAVLLVSTIFRKRGKYLIYSF